MDVTYVPINYDFETRSGPIVEFVLEAISDTRANMHKIYVREHSDSTVTVEVSYKNGLWVDIHQDQGDLLVIGTYKTSGAVRIPLASPDAAKLLRKSLF